MLDAAEGFFWGFALGVIGGVISKAAAASRVLTTAEKARTGQAAVAKLVAGEGETLVHENLWYYVGRGAKVVKGEVDILTREALHEVKNYVWKSYDDYLISKVKQRFARQVANRRLFLQEAAGLPGMPTSNRIVFWLSRGAPREVVAFLEGLGVEVRIFIP